MYIFPDPKAVLSSPCPCPCPSTPCPFAPCPSGPLASRGASHGIVTIARHRHRHDFCSRPPSPSPFRLPAPFPASSSSSSPPATGEADQDHQKAPPTQARHGSPPHPLRSRSPQRLRRSLPSPQWSETGFASVSSFVAVIHRFQCFDICPWIPAAQSRAHTSWHRECFPSWYTYVESIRSSRIPSRDLLFPSGELQRDR
jgi:hypothetical protein